MRIVFAFAFDCILFEYEKVHYLYFFDIHLFLFPIYP